MRKHIGLALFALLAAFQMGAQGIQFENSEDWQAILAKAKAADKLIFMDAYTTWCGPCKMMSRDVFPAEAVGSFYNANFINVKMDMEKGVGIDLAQTYSVQAYPTLLFVDGDGTLIHRVAGYMNVEQFVELGQQALDPERNYGALRRRFDAGERDPDFLRRFAEIAFMAYDGSHGEIVDAYLDTQGDLSDPQTMRFVFDMAEGYDSRAFQHILANREAYAAQFGAPMVDQKIQAGVYQKIYYSDPMPSLEAIEGIFKEVFPSNHGVMYANFKMSYYRQAGDRANYAKAAIARFDTYPSDDYAELNEAAWTFYEVVDDEAQLKQALKWAKKSVKLRQEYMNLDTLAALYYKLGQKRNARKYARKAIAAAQASGEDASLTEELLEKIEAL